jgi:hypothetical protein
MDRYIGLDAHSASCTVAVIGPSGRRLQHHKRANAGRSECGTERMRDGANIETK